jgi:hypothetical protein
MRSQVMNNNLMYSMGIKRDYSMGLALGKFSELGKLVGFYGRNDLVRGWNIPIYE